MNTLEAELHALGVSREEVVDGGVSVFDRSRRNVVRRVETLSGHRMSKVFDPEARVSARRERSTIQWLRETPDLVNSLPEILDSGVHEDVVETGVVAGGRSLATLGFEVALGETAGVVGALLGRLHRCSLEGFDRIAPPAPFCDGWPSAEDLVDRSWATRRVAEIIQGDEAISHGVEAALSTWTATSVVHGDLRDDNILVNVTESPGVVVVDWETSGVGDPAWDLGCFLGERLGAWAAAERRSMAEGANGARSATAVAIVQSDVADFVDGYRGEASLESGLIDRAVAFGAVRLVQRSIEASMVSNQLSRGCVLELQAASNIFESPRNARRDLLALG